MMNFYTNFLVNSPLFASPNRVSSLDYLEPVTRAAVRSILEDAAAQGTPLLVFETYRSQKRQEMLYEQKATQLKTVGTHGYGLACDLVKNVNGSPSWKGDFSFLGALAKTYGLVWGGDWGQPGVHHDWVDLCHVQRVAVKDQERLFAGQFYPSGLYDPITGTEVA